MWLLSLTAIVAITAAQQDPIQDFCRRHQHQTCVIDSKLYIDGGKVYYGGSVDSGSVAQQNTRLLWENVLATDNVTSFPRQYKNLTKDSEVPSVSGGVLWPDTTNKLFYLFGGEYHDVTSVQAFTNLWFFDVIYNKWNRSTSSDLIRAGISWPAFGGGAVTEGGTAYYYGGYLSNRTTLRWSSNPLMLSSLISFDMNTQIWNNRTYDNTSRAEGTLHYIPAASAGMLVYFGGLETDPNGRVQYANMSKIRLFDIGDNKWFTQSASGDVPSPRRGMCAGVIWPTDRSSYNFYVQGGVGEDGATFGETYILSLPSFQWQLIYPEPDLIPNTAHGKGWSSCNVVRDSQMIVIGGYYANTSYPSCDEPKEMGQHGLLLGQESAEVSPLKLQWWWRLWPDYNRYRVPDKVVSLVGGNVDGHATKTAPAQGWATPSLSRYFEGLNYVPPRTATRPVPETPTSGHLSGQRASARPNVGAIAGGSVGGVIALIVLIAIVLLCLHRRRRKQTTHSLSELDSNQKSELDGHAMARKPTTNYSVSDNGTMVSSTTPTPAYSPQASPPLATNAWNGHQHSYQGDEYIQSGSHTYLQPYYAPPAEPSTSTRRMDPHEISAELPDARSPTNAELPNVRSPVSANHQN